MSVKAIGRQFKVKFTKNLLPAALGDPADPGNRDNWGVFTVLRKGKH